jgi:hypothetical protein
MASRRSREVAYADLVAGLLDVRTDPATERFDAELAAAEDAGRIDPQTAKVLRWWQRETLRAVVEHAQAVFPPTLLALEQSATWADREVDVSSRSWARASGDDPDAPARSFSRRVPATVGTPYRAAGIEDDADVVADDYDETDETDGTNETEPATVSPLPPPTDLSEHRRKLLVAGLTRVRIQS